MELIAQIPFTALSSSVLLFALGVILGSFVNAVGLRYYGEGRLFDLSVIGGRSQCPQCQKQLSWYELIPVISFLIQQGKCRYCERPLSWQYPLVEIAGGLIMLLPVYFYNYFDLAHKVLSGQSITPYLIIAAVWTFAAFAMLLLTIIDWRLQIIPDQINLFLAGLGVVMIYLPTTSFLKNYALIFGGPMSLFANHLLAAFIGLAFFGAIIALSRGKAMGGGDMKLAGALGLLIGYPDIIVVIISAFVIGAIWGLYLIASHKKKFKENVPFGPFIVTGVFVTIFFGHTLANWYFTLI
jgi:prepilin signal peptidase PulO-like enzyme (type II secretory pathway)